jgi:hypothetical protein
MRADDVADLANYLNTKKIDYICHLLLDIFGKFFRINHRLIDIFPCPFLIADSTNHRNTLNEFLS